MRPCLIRRRGSPLFTVVGHVLGVNKQFFFFSLLFYSFMLVFLPIILLSIPIILFKYTSIILKKTINFTKWWLNMNHCLFYCSVDIYSILIMLLEDDQMLSSKVKVWFLWACSIRHFFTTYCATVHVWIGPRLLIARYCLGIILNSFVHLLFSKFCRNNLSSPSTCPKCPVVPMPMILIDTIYIICEQGLWR